MGLFGENIDADIKEFDSMFKKIEEQRKARFIAAYGDAYKKARDSLYEYSTLKDPLKANFIPNTYGGTYSDPSNYLQLFLRRIAEAKEENPEDFTVISLGQGLGILSACLKIAPQLLLRDDMIGIIRELKTIPGFDGTVLKEKIKKRLDVDKLNLTQKDQMDLFKKLLKEIV